MGHEPILIPSMEEVENGDDTPDKYPEWNRTWWKLFRMPELLIQSLDEPFSAAAQAAAQQRTLPITQAGNAQAAQKQIEKEVAVAKAKQAAKPKPAAKKKDSYLVTTFIQAQRDIVALTSTMEFREDWVASLIRTQLTTAIDRLIADQMAAFQRGYSGVSPINTGAYIDSASTARMVLRNRAEHYINRLINDLITSLRRNTKDLEAEALGAKIRSVFESLKYRTDFIEDVEVSKAHALGRLYAVGDTTKKFLVRNVAQEDACATCKLKQDLDAAEVTIEDLAPHHAGCKCLSVELIPESLTDEVEEPEIAKCPKCGKTAISKGDDLFTCRACQYTFQKIEEADVLDVAKKERCIMHLKTSLRKSHPDWDEEKIKSVAIATCTKQEGK